jgi:hypothetical protein
MAKVTKKGGSKIFWIIGGLVVIAGGIGAYFLLRKPKQEENNNDTDTDDKKPQSDSGSGAIGGGNSASPKINAPKELNTKEKIESFQDYVLDVKKDKTILGNAGADGVWGKNSENAWDKYGSDYLKSLIPASKIEPQLEKDIDTIIKFSTGTKAEKTYLQKANADFVSNWAKSVRNSKSVFVWANQVYRTKTGVKILEYNPIGKVYYASKTGLYAKNEANNNASAVNLSKGTNLGKASAVDFDGKYVFIYFPEKAGGGYSKWIYESAITSKKPSSSFSGITDELEFANFDNNLDLNL